MYVDMGLKVYKKEYGYYVDVPQFDPSQDLSSSDESESEDMTQGT